MINPKLTLAVLPLALLACGSHPPNLPATVTSVVATHDSGDGAKTLEIEQDALMSCLQTSKSLGIGEAQKCAFDDGDYSVTLNGGETIITIHTATQFTINDQGFFSNQCLYPLLAKAATGKTPAPSGC